MLEFATFVMVTLMFVPFALDKGADVVKLVRDKTGL